MIRNLKFSLCQIKIHGQIHGTWNSRKNKHKTFITCHQRNVSQQKKVDSKIEIKIPQTNQEFSPPH